MLAQLMTPEGDDRAERVTPVVRMPTLPGFRYSDEGSLGPRSGSRDVAAMADGRKTTGRVEAAEANGGNPGIRVSAAQGPGASELL